MSNEGGVIFDCQRINNILRSMQTTEPYKRSKKLSLFLDFGCKPMAGVILHHPNWEIHCRGTTIEQLSNMPVIVRNTSYPDIELAIEAIPYEPPE